MLKATRRHWADVVVIVAGVYAVLAGVWAPPEALSGDDAREVNNTAWLLLSYAGGGALALLGLVTAQRNKAVGKIMVGAAGLLVLTGFGALRQITLLAAISLGLTGLLLLAMSPLVGPMPRPEDERR